MTEPQASPYMPTRSLTLPLSGYGRPATDAHVIVETLSAKDRLVRAASVALAGLVLALIFIPIPLVHFVLVPGALVLGFVLGALRLKQREIFSFAEGRCPYCGADQRLGLRGKAFRLPRRVSCRECRRDLDLGANFSAGDRPH
jgi:hypothetical protein